MAPPLYPSPHHSQIRNRLRLKGRRDGVHRLNPGIPDHELKRTIGNGTRALTLFAPLNGRSLALPETLDFERLARRVLVLDVFALSTSPKTFKELYHMQDASHSLLHRFPTS